MTMSMSMPATATERIIAVYDGTPGEPPLASRCRELFSQQMFTWQEFAAAHLELNGAWLRELSSGPHTVLVQFNPGRTVSATAAIDDDAVRNRPCFLCPDRLPVSQAAVRYREDFLILVNPRPIFSPHYTVVHIRHLPQHLEPHIDTLLTLTRDLGDGLTVFYNGPRCGASAPDHHHFQVCPAGSIPVEKVWEENGGKRRELAGGVSLGILNLPGRTALVVEGGNRAAVADALVRLLPALRRAAERDSDEEPMLNLLCHYQDRSWRLLLFPRRRHRPAAYYREGEEAVLVTPGAVEMGGLLITVREEDFLKMNFALVEEIYREVALEGETVEKIFGAFPA